MSHSLNKAALVALFAALAMAQACGGRGSDAYDPANTDNPSTCLGCGNGSSVDPGDGDDGDGDGDGDGPMFGAVGEGPYELVPEWDGPCEETERTVDINLGHSPESAVRAIHCQITGTEPDTTTLQTWADDLATKEWVRRIDVAWAFCQQANRACSLSYSDPWQTQVLLEEPCDKKVDREVGAVFMLFSDCPGGVNCGQYWANTHALGMFSQHAIYAYGSAKAGVYNPANTGFWFRELMDARWAGLSFLMPNIYGPDLDPAEGLLDRANEALNAIGEGIGLALFDDTWGWRTTSPPPFNAVPNLANTEEAAQAIYTHKWKPFFEQLGEDHWYHHDGRPLIYFYNAGTLEPREAAPAVLARAKELFEADFGVQPFVVVDTAFFADEEGMNAVADGRFRWYTWNDGPSIQTLHDQTVAHAMVRWDNFGRDNEGTVASADDFIRKGPEALETFLEASADADVAVIATWNDLGEGTGINRNFDYYHDGEWLAPNHFMSMIREAQCL